MSGSINVHNGWTCTCPSTGYTWVRQR